MPELPEVETISNGLAQSIVNNTIVEVTVVQRQLRQQIPVAFADSIRKQRVCSVSRRGKYLLIELGRGTIIWHLGMSGSIWMHQAGYSLQRHDHVLIAFDNCTILRYNDPRRFGLIDYARTLETHKLMQNLGPEPLGEHFTGDYLFGLSRTRKTCIKNLLMNSKVVAGIGNIYACESLFHAGIRPTRSACGLSKSNCDILVVAIVETLKKAIQQGGTTLRDYVNSQGKPGYFQQQLFVYGRQGERCRVCGAQLAHVRITNRATVYCPNCQR